MAQPAVIGFGEEELGSALVWRRAHEALVRPAATRAGHDYEEGRWLLRAERAGAHVRLGFGSFREYAERLFGYGPRLVQEKLRVAEALEELPLPSAELEHGRLSFSAVRELSRVATRATEWEWLEAGRRRSIREPLFDKEQRRGVRAPDRPPETWSSPATCGSREGAMRVLTRVSFVSFSLLAAGTASAHHTAPPKRTGRAAVAPRAHQVARAHQAPRTGGRAALLPRAVEPSRTGSHAASDHVCPKTDDEGPKSSVVMRSHRIARGDSLSGIAALYGTSVQALAAANGLRASDIIRTGQDLVIPEQARPGGGNEWLKYAHAPEHPGTVDLSTYTHRFHGAAVEKGRLVPAARAAISELLGVKDSRPAVPDRLLRLLVRVSDTFGGRPIRVVSGYRTSSFFSDSRHKQSSAVDFSIPGIPNSVVREYLLLFEDVGVGYYPNSSFVHLDVRPCAMQWVDYAGPGEAPRLHPHSTRFAAAGKPGGAPTVSDLDEIAEGVAAAMNEPAPAPTLPRPAGAHAAPARRETAEPPAEPTAEPHGADTVSAASDRRD